MAETTKKTLTEVLSILHQAGWDEEPTESTPENELSPESLAPFPEEPKVVQLTIHFNPLAVEVLADSKGASPRFTSQKVDSAREVITWLLEKLPKMPTS